MLIARLNRDKLRLLTASRLLEAEVLLKKGYWTGAYYLTGLSVECALKACLAQAVQRYDLPDKNFINRLYTHKLRDLAQLDADLWQDLQLDMRTNANLSLNVHTVLDWNDENRYEIVDQQQAISLFKAATESGSGVIDWIRRRWK